MTQELGPEARALLDAARGALGPDAAAIRRMRAKIDAAVTGGAGAGPGGGGGGPGAGAGVAGAKAGGRLVAAKVGAAAVVAALAVGAIVYGLGRSGGRAAPLPDERSALAAAAPPAAAAPRGAVAPGAAPAPAPVPAPVPASGAAAAATAAGAPSSEAAPALAGDAEIELDPPAPARAPRPASRAGVSPRAATAAAPAAPAAPAPPAPRRADLAREVELVDQAMAALRRGEPAAALAAVRRHAAETAGAGQLAEDAAAIEIEALCGMHDATAAARLAAFDARWPQSAQRSRLTARCP